MATEADKVGYAIALEEAKISAREGGVPIGAALVSKDGKVLGRGHNMRVQKNSATLHPDLTEKQGETSALENAGRLPASAYEGATMYTTLSPCTMCTGACLLYNIKRVVMGENNTFVGGEDWLAAKGVEVINLHDPEAEQLMKEFIEKTPELWNEDIGE